MEENGNAKYKAHHVRWNHGTLVLGSDGICGISKHFVKPLKFCLKSHSL
jgi:hypothetical protein